MRVAILSCGAIVIKEADQEWLFGAPKGVGVALKEAGIDTPRFVFLTALRSPGYADLEGITSFKEKPLGVGSLSTAPLTRKHGTDYEIVADGAKVLFSERGDVASSELEGYDLAVIKNKHRGDDWGDNVIVWPWTDGEYQIVDNVVTSVDVSLKAWSNLDDVPSNIKIIEDTPLTLEQANFVAKIAKAAGEGDKENWAVAVAQFKSSYTKKDGEWVKQEAKEGDAEEGDDEKIQEKESYNLLMDRLNRVLREQHPSSDMGQPVEYKAYWVTDVDPDISVAYIEGDGGPYAVPYAIDDAGELRLAARDAWQPVARTWVATKQKVSKEEANYRSAEGEQRCGNCGYYADGSCSRVSGDIDASYTCDLFATTAAIEGVVGDAVSRLATADVPIIVKEMTDEGPVRRLGDVLVADLHTAYNNFADSYYRDGFMDETERKAVGQAMGPALQALRDNLSQELQDRVLDTTVPAALKELAPDVPDNIDGSWHTVYKDDNGDWRWATITSTSVWDRQDELVPPEAMEWAVKFARLVGPGPLRYKHAPGLDGGQCDRQSTVGGWLFESGTFDDTPIGQAMRKAVQSDSAWKISPGMAFSRNDLVDGRYKRFMIFERSMTKVPANPVTAMLTDGGYSKMLKQLTTEELSQVAKDLELDLSYVTALHTQALENLDSSVGLKEFSEYVAKEAKKAEKKKGSKPAFMKDADYDGDDDEDEEDEEESKKKRKEALLILKGLDVNQREQLRTLLDEADPEAQLRAEVASLKEEVQASAERSDRMINLLATMVAGGGGAAKDTQADDLAQLLEGLPRRQAAQFSVTKDTAPDEQDDDAVMALLKEIREEVTKSQAGFTAGGPMYDMFTSKKLNPGQEGN